uniref:Uncharacterized protein MANES_16G031000 n=1 Tax=Rhizophora mucronata TaxID=61149 RepID=A0A2P2IQD4_RHIMU
MAGRWMIPSTNNLHFNFASRIITLLPPNESQETERTNSQVLRKKVKEEISSVEEHHNTRATQHK